MSGNDCVALLALGPRILWLVMETNTIQEYTLLGFSWTACWRCEGLPTGRVCNRLPYRVYSQRSGLLSILWLTT